MPVPSRRVVAAASLRLFTYTGSTADVVFLVTVALALIVVTVRCVRYFSAVAVEQRPSPTIACLNDQHVLCDGRWRGSPTLCSCECHRP